MFVPVSCTNCGKPFQVPEAALGKLAPCPWCQSTVPALPVSAPRPEVPVTPAAPAPVPLSLDDAPAPDREPAPVGAVATLPDGPAVPGPEPRRRFNPVTLVVGLALVLVVMALTVLFLSYRSGRLPEAGWTEFTPPDGSFTVSLPGRPTEEVTDPVPEASLTGGARFTANRWYARTTAWVAYGDLESSLVQKLRSDKDRVITAGVLRIARDREVARLRAAITKEAEVRLNAGWGIELHLDAPDGPAVVRLILQGEGGHPRLYSFGVQGKAVTPTSPACQRMLSSFRVND